MPRRAYEVYDDGVVDAVQVEEVALPGIGVRHDFVAASGPRVGVVLHRSGRRDLLLYDEEDPDACSAVIVLTTEEADALAEALGSPRVVQRLAALNEQVAALNTGQLRTSAGSAYDGWLLGDTQARSRTGVSIVAVIRHGEAVPSPGPDFRLLGGDTVIVVGTTEGVAALGENLASKGR